MNGLDVSGEAWLLAEAWIKSRGWCSVRVPLAEVDHSRLAGLSVRRLETDDGVQALLGAHLGEMVFQVRAPSLGSTPQASHQTA